MISLTAPSTPKSLDRLVHRREIARRQQRAKRGALLAAGCAGVGVSAVVLASRRRRNALRGRAASVTHAGPEGSYDDVTLARKVESEIFRPADAPKGEVNVAAHDGVVELRGIVRRAEQIDELVSKAADVKGVERVENLLHLPGTPARHADPARSSLNNGS